MHLLQYIHTHRTSSGTSTRTSFVLFIFEMNAFLFKSFFSLWPVCLFSGVSCVSCIFLLVVLCLVAGNSANEGPERLVFNMTCYVQMRILKATNSLNEKSARICKHCMLAVVRQSQNFFAPPETPFPGVWDGQNLIRWRW